MKYKCKQCSYWVSVDQEDGECHYHAPVVIADGYEVGSVAPLTVWPETKANDGCGKIKLNQ